LLKLRRSSLGSCGIGNASMGQPLDLGGLVDRSLRHLGQLLVVMGALLGAALGVGLALVVENAGTSGTVVASGASGSQGGEAAGQAGQTGGKANKSKDGRHDHHGKGTDKAKERTTARKR
jgi:hypothetical protein